MLKQMYIKNINFDITLWYHFKEIVIFQELYRKK